jgi:3-hydroxyisobutyrate dehydrogenase-like beta-hydroxyacid dehydrogenase
VAAATTTVGVVGLGLIGTSLAKRLLAAGFSVHGYDIDAKRALNLSALGGFATERAHDVGRACPVVILAVFDTQQVEDVLEGAEGIAPQAGQLIICTTTCDPDSIVALNERLAAQGVRFLEVPLSGNSNEIALGHGVALVGGERAAMDEAAPILAAISKQQFHLGPVGSGGRAKLMAEGLAFAEALGLDLPSFLEVLKNSAVYSRAMDTRGDKMVRSEFSPHAWLKQSHKDFTLMKTAADRVGQELPLAKIYTELIESCLAHGEGELDNSAIIQEIRRRRRK